MFACSHFLTFFATENLYSEPQSRRRHTSSRRQRPLELGVWGVLWAPQRGWGRSHESSEILSDLRAVGDTWGHIKWWVMQAKFMTKMKENWVQWSLARAAINFFFFVTENVYSEPQSVKPKASHLVTHAAALTAGGLGDALSPPVWFGAEPR